MPVPVPVCGGEREQKRKWKKNKTFLLWTKPIFESKYNSFGLWRSPNKTKYKYTENRKKKTKRKKIHSNKLIDTNTSYLCVCVCWVFYIFSHSLFFFVIVSTFLRNWSIYFVCCCSCCYYCGCLSTWLLFHRCRQRRRRQGESARFLTLHNSLW